MRRRGPCPVLPFLPNQNYNCCLLWRRWVCGRRRAFPCFPRSFLRGKRGKRSRSAGSRSSTYPPAILFRLCDVSRLAVSIGETVGPGALTAGLEKRYVVLWCRRRLALRLGEGPCKASCRPLDWLEYCQQGRDGCPVACPCLKLFTGHKSRKVIQSNSVIQKILIFRAGSSCKIKGLSSVM
jgi:hypothetical protein